MAEPDQRPSSHSERRAPSVARPRNIGSATLRHPGLSAEAARLLEQLPTRPKPPFLSRFEKRCLEVGFPLDTITLADRPRVALHAYEFIINDIKVHNDDRAKRGDSMLGLSANSKLIPLELDKYYDKFHASLTGTEPADIRQLREDYLAENTLTARSNIPLAASQGEIDLRLVSGFETMMTEFYPGPAALASTELLAAYGEGRTRLVLVADSH